MLIQYQWKEESYVGDANKDLILIMMLELKIS